MNGLKSIFDDAHGLLGLALIIAATVLAAIGIMPLEMWKSYTQVIFGTFAAAHAVIAGSAYISSRGSMGPDTVSIIAKLAESFIVSKSSPTIVTTPDVPAESAASEPTPPATPNQAGYIIAPLILFLTVIGACLVTMIILSCGSACDPAKTVCTMQNSAISCGETEVAQVILDHGGEVEKVITGATNPADGSVDWTSIADQLEAYALKYGSCVIAQIFDHYISSKTTVLVAGAYKIPTPAAARDGFNQLRTKLWSGKTFKLSNGHIL